MSGLHEAFDEIVADVPVYGDLDRAIEQADQERRRRRGMVAGLAAAAAVVAVIVGAVAITGDGGKVEQPTEPVTPTELGPVLRNGQFTDAETHFGVEPPGYGWRSFDPASGTGLFLTASDADDGFGLEGLVVVGPNGPVATLTCARDLPCSPGDSWTGYVATLGPGVDEVTVTPDDRTAQIIGYDGTLRRTIDLTATITAGGGVRGLRWSADGSLLAVVTWQLLDDSGKSASRLWLVNREGGDAQLAYSLLYDDTLGRGDDAPGFDGKGTIWTPSGWGWSRDGRSLLLDVRTIGTYGADVVLLHLQPDGAADPVIAQTLYHSNRMFDWAGNIAWSPDATRIVVRTMVRTTSAGTTAERDRITEISAEDGSVIAQHPPLTGWLIWPAAKGENP